MTARGVQRDMVTYEVTATAPQGYQVTVISPGWQGAIVGDFNSLSAAETLAHRMRTSTPVALISLSIPRRGKRARPTVELPNNRQNVAPKSRTDLAEIGAARPEVRAGDDEGRHRGGATPRAAPLQPHERDVALAGADQRLEVGVARVPACLAPDVDAEAGRRHRTACHGYWPVRQRDAGLGPAAAGMVSTTAAVAQLYGPCGGNDRR
jgi:hypothetical protein